MDRFSRKILVGGESRLFEFTRMKDANGVKFFITTIDVNKKPIAFSLRQSKYGTDWKLIPGSLRWLYEIESELSSVIIETA